MSKNAQAFHYYGSTVYGWATAGTKEQVLKALAQDCGSSILSRAKKRAGGIEATVCRVELPAAAHYTIAGYLPGVITKEDGVNETRKGEAVPISELEPVRIVTMQGRSIPR